VNAIKKEGTILFCDIRGFTALLDERDPEEAWKLTASVVAVLGGEVERFGGVVDKFTGDGFLAHYNFSNDMADHVSAACRTALGLRNKLVELNRDRYFEIESVINIGIAISFRSRRLRHSANEAACANNHYGGCRESCRTDRKHDKIFYGGYSAF
jgi:class 3 adenylate cyclase